MACLAMRGRVPGLYRGGEKCYGFAENLFTFPERTDEECRQNGSRSDCPISSPRKVPPIRGNLVHFPGKNGKKGGRINIFEGKVHQMTGKMVHFPDTDEMILT